MAESKTRSFSLDVIQIKSPCNENWENMAVHGSTRYCEKCELHVHDLMAMSSEQVQSLLANTEGRLCVRMVRDVPRREPRGWRSVMRSGAQPMWKRVAAAAGILFVGLWGAVMPGCKEQVAGGLQPGPHATPPPQKAGVMGDVCEPPATQPIVDMGKAVVRQQKTDPESPQN